MSLEEIITSHKNNWAQEIASLKAERDGLLSAITQWRENANQWEQTCSVLKTQIAALRADFDDCNITREHLKQRLDHYVATIGRENIQLEEANERLRTALDALIVAVRNGTHQTYLLAVADESEKVL